jgi:hypothetical protein
VERLGRQVAAVSGRDEGSAVEVPGIRDEIAALAGTMNELLARAPGTARRYRGGALQTVPLEVVEIGDVLLAAPGDVLPVDGIVTAGVALLDESALTGEALPVEHGPGDSVRSGTVNRGGPFDLRATTSAADSTYAGKIRLVSEAETSQPPFVRLADRYAAWFLPLTPALAGVAWAVAGAARAVAVLVVATPYPLILAAPVALVSGLSAAAPRGDEPGAISRVRHVHGLLIGEVWPHESAEETELYPSLNRTLGGADPTAPMSRAHAEIAHQIARLGRLIEDIGDREPDAAETADLRGLLYGLYAILALHTVQEDETYLSLGNDADALSR